MAQQKRGQRKTRTPNNVMFGNMLIHELGLTPQPKTEYDVQCLTERALDLGAAGIEWVFWPEGNLDPKVMAKATLKAGAKKGSLCLFQPGGKFGDPLVPTERAPSLQHLDAGIIHAYRMREAGLDIQTVDGPLCFTLGEQDYEQGEATIHAAIEFLKLAARTAEAYAINLAVERLQKAEDGAVQSSSRLARIIDAVGSMRVGAHEDAFHSSKNGERPQDSIRALDHRLMHFHANGIGLNPETDGRIPCGCNHLVIGNNTYTDTVNWADVAFELARLRQPSSSVLFCLEPFSEAACNLIPPLRTGVIPVTYDHQIELSVRTLFQAGLLQRV